MCNFLYGMQTSSPTQETKTHQPELEAPLCTSHNHIFQIKHDFVNKYFQHSIQNTEKCMHGSWV